MTKKMLFNATQVDELRIAIVDGRSLCDLQIEHLGREQNKANVYKAVVTRIEPSLEAAFVDYGQERHGFLPLKEVLGSQIFTDNNRPTIHDLLKVGDQIVVQVQKPERGTKGAALSMLISLAGTYSVLMPNNPRAGGVSRRIEGEDRQTMKDALSKLTIPENMGVIIRTAGIGRSTEELQWDLNYLIKLWETIKNAGEAPTSKPPFLIYQESDAILRALRDYLRPDIDEIIIDNPTVYHKVRQHMMIFRPEQIERVRLYNDITPLFTRYQIESQIESVYQRNIRLPSGGSIVIDRTEALVAIDINSAQATKGGDIEETAFNTNLEAADEIARQLRLRDLGGLIVIDFIDMVSNSHQRAVEERLAAAITHDRARIQSGRISRFGLLEMSRQRLRSAVGESTQEACPRCHGRGSIRDVESVSISVLRLIEENAAKEGTQQVHAQVPVKVATYLLNEKRRQIADMESKLKVLIFIIPNPHLETPDFEVTRFKQTAAGIPDIASYKLVDEDKRTEMAPVAKTGIDEKDIPVVREVMPEQPAPITASNSSNKPGLISRLLQQLVGKKESTTQTIRRHSHDRDSTTSGHRGPRTPGQRNGNRNHSNLRQKRKGQGSDRRHTNNRHGSGESRHTHNQKTTQSSHTHAPRLAAGQQPKEPVVRETRPAHSPRPVSPAPQQAPVMPKPVEHSSAVKPAAENKIKTEPHLINVNPPAPQTLNVEPVVEVKPAAKPLPRYTDKVTAAKYEQVETEATKRQAISAEEPKAPARVRPVRPQRSAESRAMPEQLVMVETLRQDDVAGKKE